MPADMDVDSQKRANLRPQLESGKSRRTAKAFDVAWLKEKWPEMLDLHYKCVVPGPSACLQDALHMTTTGKVRITCPGAKKQEEKEPRTLSELEVRVIKQWYEAKDQKLVEERGNAVGRREASDGASERGQR